MKSQGQRSLSAGDLTAGRVVWLLDVTWASDVWLFSTEIVTPLDGTVEYRYRGGLGEITYADTMDLFELGISGKSATIEAMFPVSVAALVADGYDLAGAVCELSRWVEGTDLGNRHVVLRGRVSDPQYGGSGTSTRFALKQDYAADTGLFPPTSARVSSATSDTTIVDSSEIGLYYPWIFGFPGRVTGYLNTVATGSQAVWRAKSYNHELVVAGHPVTAAYVAIIDADATVAGSPGSSGLTWFAVSESVDYSGRLISVISNSHEAASTFTAPDSAGAPVTRYAGLYGGGTPADADAAFQSAKADTHGIFVYWQDPDDQNGGGLPDPLDPSQPLRGAGGIIREILSYSTLAIDTEQMAASLAVLDAFRLDFSVDEQATAWEFVAGALLPILPVSVVGGPFGLTVIPWNWEATATDAVCHLDADTYPAISTAERVQVDTSQIANEFRLEYARSLRADTFNASFTVGAERHNDYYATGILSLYEGYIRVYALDAGAAGQITISIGTSTSNGLIDNAIARDVAVVLDNAPQPTVATFVTLLNTSTLIRAELVGGNSAALLDGATTREDASGFAVAQSTTLTLPADYFAGAFDRRCTESQRRYAAVINPESDTPGRAQKSMESVCIYDPATAAQVLGWQAAAYCFARRTVDFSAPEGQYGWLRLGDRVLLTDARLGFASSLATLTTLEYGSDGLIAGTLTFTD